MQTPAPANGVELGKEATRGEGRKPSWESVEEMSRQQARERGAVTSRQAVVAAVLLGRKKAEGNILLQIKKTPGCGAVLIFLCMRTCSSHSCVLSQSLA